MPEDGVSGGAVGVSAERQRDHVARNGAIETRRDEHLLFRTGCRGRCGIDVTTFGVLSRFAVPESTVQTGVIFLLLHHATIPITILDYTLFF